MKKAFILLTTLLALASVTQASPVDAAANFVGRCYPFDDLPRNGPLIDIQQKGKLVKNRNGQFKGLQPNRKIYEWEVSVNPIHIINHGRSTGHANVVQVFIQRNDLPQGPIENYYFNIAGGDECKHTASEKLEAIFSNSKNKIVSVFHYPLAHFP
jgi:hypothetical protein